MLIDLNQRKCFSHSYQRAKISIRDFTGIFILKLYTQIWQEIKPVSLMQTNFFKPLRFFALLFSSSCCCYCVFCWVIFSYLFKYTCQLIFGLENYKCLFTRALSITMSQYKQKSPSIALAMSECFWLDTDAEILFPAFVYSVT